MRKCGNEKMWKFYTNHKLALISSFKYDAISNMYSIFTSPHFHIFTSAQYPYMLLIYYSHHSS